MRRRVRYIGIVLIISAVFALIFISVYAVSGRGDDGTLQGRTLVWHAYSGAEAEVFTEMLDRFRDMHPNVTIMQQAFPDATTLQEEYLNAVGSGLGPDVIIGPSTWIGTLAPAGQIDPIGQSTPEDVWLRYTSATLDTVTYEEDFYAIPLAFNTMALYYNRSVISNTVSTTDGLEREASQSAMVLMSTTFRDAFWGINAFGGQLFDEESRVVLDRGGFANWLAWLSNLRNYPGVILDNNRDALRNRFLQGDVAYYFGYASELSAIVEGLELENIGVSPLPAGPVANAQPFLEVTAFMFNPVSSNNQRKLGLELAQFLSNSEQSGALMRRVRSVPANQRVRINPRLNPIVSSFATQARAAAPLMNTPEMEAALRLGSEAYLRVLDGGVPPAEAAVAITSQINEANQIDAVAQTEFACTNLGTVRLLHTWEDEDLVVLEELIDRFRAVCPLIIIDAEYESPQNIAARLQSTAPGIGRGFAILGSPELMQVLMREEQPLLKDLTPYVSSELLQRFQPNGVDTMRFQRTLYGLPVYLEVDALYFNRQLIDTPAQTIDDLRTQAGQGVPIELDINFEKAYWGVGAFGGRLFDSENRLLLDQGGMAPWLAWLYESRESFGMNLSTDSEALRSRFEAGQSAYYVGSSSELNELLESLGDESLGVAEPPDGPGGNAMPLLSSQGFFLSQAGSDTQVALALEFIQFATNSENQMYLAEAGGLIPVNAAIDLSEGTYMDTLMSVARNAIAKPNSIHMQTVLARGDTYYERVLEGGDAPETVVAELTTAINDEHGIAPLPTPEPTQPPAPEPVEEEDDDSLMLEGDDPGANIEATPEADSENASNE